MRQGAIQNEGTEKEHENLSLHPHTLGSTCLQDQTRSTL